MSVGRSGGACAIHIRFFGGGRSLKKGNWAVALAWFLAEVTFFVGLIIIIAQGSHVSSFKIVSPNSLLWQLANSGRWVSKLFLPFSLLFVSFLCMPAFPPCILLSQVKFFFKFMFVLSKPCFSSDLFLVVLCVYTGLTLFFGKKKYIFFLTFAPQGGQTN